MEFHELVSKLKELAREKNGTPTLREFVASGASKRQVQKHKFNEIVRAAGLEPNQSAHTFEPIEPIVKDPKILVFDIETSAMLVKTYSLKTDYISHKNIVKEWHFLSYAGKFLFEDKIYYLDQRYSPDKSDDRQLLEGLHDLICQADALVGHNIDGFDLKKFNTRAAFYDLPPIHEIPTYDTLKMARRRYALPSNSLDYCAKFFRLENRKSGHGKFPGDQLWDECLLGNLEAWEECEDYNKKDVLATEELFLKLAKNDPRINIQSFQQKPTCICGNQTFFKDGFKYGKGFVKQRYRCHICLKVYLAKENLINKDLRKGFFQ
jgi:hypothetical protein